MTTVRIWQVNTRKRIVAHVPTEDGVPVVEGDLAIAGIPFPGASIRLEHLDPGGSCTAGLLPTGRIVDEIDVPGLGRVEATLVDTTNPVVFVRAADLGLRGTELAEEIDVSLDLLRTLEHVRARAAVMMGLVSTAEEASATRPGTPKVAFVTPPADFVTQEGTRVSAEDVSLLSRIMSMGSLHRSYAVTGGIATAAAAALPGSVVHGVTRPGTPSEEIRVGHPSGVLPVGARVVQGPDGPRCEVGIAYRTARLLMDGAVFVPTSVTRPAVAT
jgi:2-methylaconitate isomerase